jgi:hypothetical protein
MSITDHAKAMVCCYRDQFCAKVGKKFKSLLGLTGSASWVTFSIGTGTKARTVVSHNSPGAKQVEQQSQEHYYRCRYSMGWYHGQIANGEDPFAGASHSLPPKEPNLDTSALQSIYHLCQRTVFAEAVAAGTPYFPPTFVKDGRFTRASQDRGSLVNTANQYYKSTPGEWICLELDAQQILQLGIQILPQCAPEGTAANPINCLQIFGGIATNVPGLVISIYKMIRLADGFFYSMADTPSADIPCLHKRQVERKGQVEESAPGNVAEAVNEKSGRKIGNPFRRK